MNETIKSSIRASDPQFHSKQNGTGKPEYYRVSVTSEYKSTGNNRDATFVTNHLFPNHRQDLLNGEWQVFVENFTGYFDGRQGDHDGIKVCLPDLCHSSNNYVSTDVGKFIVDDSVQVVPIPHQALVLINADGDDVAQFEVMPLVFSRRVNENDVGAKVDAKALMGGLLRVVLRDAGDHLILDRNAIADDDSWNITLLFVHKP